MGQDRLPDRPAGRGACLITALMVLISAVTFLVPLLLVLLRN